MREVDDRPDGNSNGTWTRAQLLEHRGYPADTPPNGNGDVLSLSRETEAAARVCRACGVELTGPPQKVWCSEQCRGRGRTRNRNPARRPRKTPQRAAVAPKPELLRTRRPRNVNGSSGEVCATVHSYAGDANVTSSAGLLEVLAGAGVTLVSAHVTWGGRSWVVTPGDPGG